MINYIKYFPSDAPDPLETEPAPETETAPPTHIDANHNYIIPAIKTKKRSTKKRFIGLKRIQNSALSKATSTKVQKRLKIRAAKEQRTYEEQIRQEKLKKEKRLQIKKARILIEKQEIAKDRKRQDRVRKKALYRKNVPALQLIAPASKLMDRILKSQPLTQRGQRGSGESLSGTPSVISRDQKDNHHHQYQYQYTSNRIQTAVEQLAVVLRNIKDKDPKRQELLLEALKQAVSKQSLPLNSTIAVFCRGFSKIHRFDPKKQFLFSHVFLNIFGSRKAKERLFRHLIVTFGLEKESDIVLQGPDAVDVQEYVRDVLCSLLRLQCLDIKAMLAFNTNSGKTITPSQKILNKCTDIETQTRAKNRMTLFWTWYESHKGDGPRKLREEAAIEIITSRMKTYYSKFTILQTKQQRYLYKEIQKIVGPVSDDLSNQHKKETTARIFAGAWCGCHLTVNCTGNEVKSAIHRYDSLFSSIYRHHANLEVMLFNFILTAISTIPGNGDLNDPLIGAMKGLYNIYALDGQTLLTWHATQLGQWKGLSVLTQEDEKELKTRTQSLVEFIELEMGKSISKSEKKENAKEVTNEFNETAEQKKRKEQEKFKEKAQKLEQIKRFMAPPIEDTIPDIPITCRRAPAEAARSLRLNRKCWASSLQTRPETPLFGNWSPLEGAALTDRSKPSYPKSMTVVVHNHRPPPSTAHVGMSKKQKKLLSHYHDGTTIVPMPPKVKESKQRQRFNAHRKLVESGSVVKPLKKNTQYNNN